jgi:hypothetical protein
MRQHLHGQLSTGIGKGKHFTGPDVDDGDSLRLKIQLR